jgi:hypothetical protein
MTKMRTSNVARARVVASGALLAALAVGGVSLSTRTNAAVTERPGPYGHHHSHDRTVGQHNTTISSHSPIRQRGPQSNAPTSSGGQNSTQNALCRKAPCWISQKVNMFDPDLSAFIALGPSDFLMVP